MYIHAHLAYILLTQTHILCTHRGLLKKMRFLDYNFDKPFHADQKRDFVMVCAESHGSYMLYSTMGCVL